MAGTPEKMLEHLLEGCRDNRNEAEIGTLEFSIFQTLFH